MTLDSDTPLIDQIIRAPEVFDSRAAHIGMDRWLASVKGLSASSATDQQRIMSSPPAKRLLEGVFGASPFLARTILNDPGFSIRAFVQAPADTLRETLASTALASAEEKPVLMKQLRSARTRAALVVALADLAGIFSVADVCGALTEFADAAVQATLRHLLRSACERQQLGVRDVNMPEASSGLILLAMGKYGARELNYSSDIDLIAFYDRDILPVSGVEQAKFTARLVQDLTHILQSRTEDGYVFRVDFRLRPDGNAGPLAISTIAAEHYYESAGQNWERAAFIKARTCAGDFEAGKEFLRTLSPYVWRKNLDFAAIDDIHSIKRQIHASKGHSVIAVAGHNIKLGRGGIREIEFFAQTQQLILGGRLADLRERATCEALKRLCSCALIAEIARDELIESYEFLRLIEHRLQMLEDEQTHTIPASIEGIEQLARFAGYRDVSQFQSDVRFHLQRVQRHYANLFEGAEPLSAQSGNLVFTGVEDDAETLRTIAELGFQSPREISSRVRGWHHGRIRATRSPRARETLTQLVPILLSAIGRAPAPDATFAAFSRLIEVLPGGAQIFTVLHSKPHMLDILVEIFSLAPRLAQVLTERPALLDALVDPEFAEPKTDEPAPDIALAGLIEQSKTLEGALDQARAFARELQFRTALRVLNRSLAPAHAGEAFSMIADCSIRALLTLAEVEIARRHGNVPSGTFSVLALGKLGGREMTASSDLDLLFVYDFDVNNPTSDGNAPLHAAQYFARLSQRLISLLTVSTAQGRLYEVDMRLRPSGNAGPVAVTLESFADYHEKHAWTFEHMSLTRARIVAGSPRLAENLQSALHRLLTMKRDPRELVRDALDMRMRVVAAKPARDHWDLKHVRGGMVDLEYIAQLLVLLHAHSSPEILATSTAEMIRRLGDCGAIDAEDLQDLIGALSLYQSLTQFLRMVFESETSPAVASTHLQIRLCELTQMASFSVLEQRLCDAQARVLALFTKYVERAVDGGAAERGGPHA